MTGGERLYLIDTSAHARLRVPVVRSVIAGFIADGVAATCVTVDLEACYSGRDSSEVRAIARRRQELYRVLAIDERAAHRARDVQVRMATRGLHRAAGIVDLLSAAVAEQHDAVVVHYDADFEHIASVTGQRQTWIAPRGSLD